jgi:hypothetical protein
MASEVYSVSGDTATGVVYFIALRQEIIDDPVAPASDSILVNGDVLTLYFASALNPTEKAALDAVVGAHPAGSVETRNPDAGTQSYAYPRDPGVGDDSDTLGAQRGDVWLNTLTGAAYICQSNDTGAAVWIPQGGGGGAGDSAPGQYLLGGILDYPGSARMDASEIQYSRVFLPAGIELTEGVTFIDTLGSAIRNVRMGLYAQADPTDIFGLPVTRVAQSNETPTGPGLDGSYLQLAFTDAPTGGSGSPVSYTVPDTGYYWIALVSDNNVTKLATSLVYREEYLPARREISTDTTLPAAAGTLTNPSSAVALAIVEV